ncbi:MAG: penicillin-binding protein 1C [Bacteroidia bacterium]|nr:penicillin-binding protein 1C [Bacteroidia bacterium]
MKNLITRFKKRKWLFVIIAIVIILFYFALPTPLFNKPYSYILLDRNGELLQARIASDGQWRFAGEGELPQKFELALLTFEDKHFYHHPGINPWAIIRAARLNLLQKKIVSGGSTISMQVIRLSRNKPRTIFQKCIELMLALRLECAYSKKEILALYANHAPFGGNVVGLQTAAWRYFGRDANQLSWAEAASLAILPNSPAMVRPDRNRNILLLKRNMLLDAMQKRGIIDIETCLLAKQEPIPQKPLPLPEEAPHLLGSITNGVLIQKNNFTPVIHSTLDAKLQHAVTNIIERHHVILAANGIQNAAAIIMDTERGNVLAYVGNVYHPEQPDIDSYVDMIPARRSPGSTLKPLLFAAMLQDGLILPHALIADIPTQIAGYAPQNFDLQHDGAVAASRALARSLNIPAVRMLQQYRVERFYTLLQKLEIKSLDKGAMHYGLSLILGGGENSMWEICGVYASLARMLNHYPVYNGHYNLTDLHEPIVVENKNKQVIKAIDWQNMPDNFIPGAGAVYNTFEAMQDLMRPGDEYLWTLFNSSKHIAWKTGTSFGFRDGWAIGITPKQVVAVWTGNADGEGRPTLTGISTAAPIMFEIFKLLPDAGWFELPYDDMQQVVTCKQSGYIASAICDDKDTIYTSKHTGNLPVCNYHQWVHTDITKKFRVSSECMPPSKMLHQSWFVLPPAMEWYYKNHNPDYRTLPPWASDCLNAQNNSGSMEMIYPKKLTAIYVPVELDGKSGSCVFEVAHRNKQATIYWHLDDKYLGSTKEFHSYGLNPSAGKHTLTLVDETGERLEQLFEVMVNK